MAEDIAKDTDYSLPQRDAGFAKSVNGPLGDVVSKGASIVFGAKTEVSDIEKNMSISPIILAITSEMLLDSVESYGPILSVYKYDNIDTLISKVNKDISPLKVSNWSANTLNAILIAKRIECGGIHINNSTVHDEATIPHGGFKDSGLGRSNGSWGIEEFTYIKTITINE